MAMAGLKTVIVDCDLRRRNLNKLMNIEPEAGLLEVLAGEIPVSKALILDQKSGLWVLPLTKSAFTPRDIFSSQAIDTLLEQLREHFDIVLLDTAPVLPVADTRVLVHKSDVVVLLAQWRKTPRDAVRMALQLLRAVHTQIAGVALTQVDVREQAKYGYGDAGYSYNAYRKSYAQ